MSRLKCKRCGGKGRITVPMNLFGKETTIENLCPVCNGTGGKWVENLEEG